MKRKMKIDGVLCWAERVKIADLDWMKENEDIEPVRPNPLRGRRILGLPAQMYRRVENARNALLRD